MRGRERAPALYPARGGITPAYAGKRISTSCGYRFIVDHPRVCGEESMVAPSSGPCTGSPPRMRGRAGPNSAHNMASGITPAYAGKRASASPAPNVLWDHPRVCGEESIVRPNSAPGTGSPPRMRGRARVETAGKPAPGITPAYAGKRYQDSFPQSTSRDHPRVCGEEPKKIP